MASPRVRAVVIGLGMALVLAACGGDTGADAGGPAAPASTSSPPAPTSAGEAPATDGTIDLPNIEVVQLATGDAVPLRSLAEPGRPTLLWFWAPHCSICRREAPEVLAFAEDHDTEVDVLGLGAQDSLEQAHGFLDDTGTHDLAMVWDPSGQSWIHHGVTSQPTVIVLDADGQVAGTWFRDFDPEAILAAAGVS